MRKNKTEQARSKLENLDELISAAQEFTNTDLDENETIIDAFFNTYIFRGRRRSR